MGNDNVDVMRQLEEGQDYYNEQAQLMGKILSLAKQLR